ncbi:guanosine-3',5'-bis(diphosphate) 3'-pyrophosphohydrolase MESH1 [Neocloeon triangulifer]|uniref:guanosine-3',5'-bis(diphosphate) 3'-pyrophosphohydrolase MESH1 n=1 Tax=Neocloeon triangulifer TaxID=2078957 RepID=UPI00286F1E0C|nr:guanosine-3',5'-bis(diphosphate) 3'-pyrophosphohydrolase MESH1 [Neocloeon triangulifer]
MTEQLVLNFDSAGASEESPSGVLIRCAFFAAHKHSNQRRKNVDSTPYINHPLGVAFILTNEAGVTDLNVLQAAILHDTVEDTDTTFEEVESHFGAKVRSIVAEVTDDKTLAKQERKEAQVRNAPKKSYEAKLVKLADKLYNLRDLSSPNGRPQDWDDERVREYYRWARRVVEGLKGTHQGLEDKIFKLCDKGEKI